MPNAIPQDAKRLAYRARGSGRWDHAGPYELVDVVKRTPAQVIIDAGGGKQKKFWIKDGSEVGGRSTVEVITAQITDAIQRTRYRGGIQSLCYKIEETVQQKIRHNADFERLPLPKLQMFHRILMEQLAVLNDWVGSASAAAGRTPAIAELDDPSTD
jgi:hypothetical protein